jgi:hypothetical protein
VQLTIVGAITFAPDVVKLFEQITRLVKILQPGDVFSVISSRDRWGITTLPLANAPS